MTMNSGAAYAHLPLLVGIMTVVGHMWTCYLGFKGGKTAAANCQMLCLPCNRAKSDL